MLPTNPKTEFEEDINRIQSDLEKLKEHYPVFAEHHWNDLQQTLALFRAPPADFQWNGTAMRTIFGDPATWIDSNEQDHSVDVGAGAANFFQLRYI